MIILKKYLYQKQKLTGLCALLFFASIRKEHDMIALGDPFYMSTHKTRLRNLPENLRKCENINIMARVLSKFWTIDQWKIWIGCDNKGRITENYEDVKRLVEEDNHDQIWKMIKKKQKKK